MTPGSLNLTVFYSKENLTIFSFILGVLKFYNKELLHLQIYLIDRIISGCRGTHYRPSWSQIHRDSPVSASWVFRLEVCTTLYSAFSCNFQTYFYTQNYCHTDQLQFSFMTKCGPCLLPMHVNRMYKRPRQCLSPLTPKFNRDCLWGNTQT